MSSSSSSNLDAQKNVPFSKRAVKSAPTIIKDKDAVRERRRDLFMKKVASNRQDKKWESRGEQVSYFSEKNNSYPSQRVGR